MQTAPTPEKLRRTLARQRAQVKARLVANWQQAQALAVQIEAASATKRSCRRQLARLDELRLDATQLAETGAALDLQVAELGNVGRRPTGTRQRPRVARPF